MAIFLARKHTSLPALRALLCAFEARVWRTGPPLTLLESMQLLLKQHQHSLLYWPLALPPCQSLHCEAVASPHLYAVRFAELHRVMDAECEEVAGASWDELIYPQFIHLLHKRLSSAASSQDYHIKRHGDAGAFEFHLRRGCHYLQEVCALRAQEKGGSRALCALTL